MFRAEDKMPFSVTGAKSRLKTREGVTIYVSKKPTEPADFYHLAIALLENKSYYNDKIEELLLWISFDGPRWKTNDLSANVLMLAVDLMQVAMSGNHLEAKAWLEKSQPQPDQASQLEMKNQFEKLRIKLNLGSTNIPLAFQAKMAKYVKEMILFKSMPGGNIESKKLHKSLVKQISDLIVESVELKKKPKPQSLHRQFAEQVRITEDEKESQSPSPLRSIAVI